MIEHSGTPNQSQPNSSDNTLQNLLKQAASAEANHDAPLALHLYLAAFERAQAADGQINEDAIKGLKRAWNLACQCKERSLAEHIFERLEPYLTHGETQECVAQLQNLSLDKLAEFGFDREKLQDMAAMFGAELGEGTSIHIEQLPVVGQPAAKEQPQETPEIAFGAQSLTFAELKGYKHAIDAARAMGIGRVDDPVYQEWSDRLRAFHGITEPPAPHAILVRAAAREDASRFVDAIAGELDLAGIAMRIEEGFQGASVLCISTDKNSELKYSAHTGTLRGKGVLILEDLDLWDLPPIEQHEGANGFLQAQLSRGAREAINLIHSAIVNPQVQVIASASSEQEVESFFLDLLEPFEVLEIDLPTTGERAEIWLDIIHEHPSLQYIDRANLVRYSEHMARFDIYSAAREAVEESFRYDLKHEDCQPVPSALLFEKLAAYQPLESDEYRALEDVIVEGLWAEGTSVDQVIGSSRGK